MESSPTQELLNDNSKLESKVVLALSRIAAKKKLSRSNGITCRQIVNYLYENYFQLDGDIESQVMTALLSCVKTGSVCALENGRYLLAGPGSKVVISKCVARASHGPKCSCPSTIRRMSRSFQNTCCFVKTSPSQGRKGKKAAAAAVAKATETNPPGSDQSKGGQVPGCRSKKCVHRAQRLMEGKDVRAPRRASEGVVSLCDYCLEMHVVRKRTSDRLCKTCHPVRNGFVAPYNKFSPREEIRERKKS